MPVIRLTGRAMDFSARLPSCSDYVHALEEERNKIQVFQRELPLCLQLVTHAIETVRQQMSSDARTTSDNNGPVLEEFIPLRPSSPYSEDRSVDGADKNSSSAATGSETKPDWLRSVQLWNQDADAVAKAEPPTKPIAVSAKRIGGAFHPFEREKHVAAPPAASAATPPAAATSSTTSGGGGGGVGVDVGAGVDGGGEAKEKEGLSHHHRKTRRCWSPELHRRFLHSLEQLGGSHVATPKQIRELMKVDGLTNDEVKSHLQKYRLHNRRPSTAVPSSSNATTSTPIPQFVVVGGIWVPPADYAAAVAAAARPADGPCAPAGGIYVPAASLASDSGFQQRSKKQSHRSPAGPIDSRGRCSAENNSTGDVADAAAAVKPVSPATSSSSETTTASPHPQTS